MKINKTINRILRLGRYDFETIPEIIPSVNVGSQEIRDDFPLSFLSKNIGIFHRLFIGDKIFPGLGTFRDSSDRKEYPQSVKAINLYLVSLNFHPRLHQKIANYCNT